MRNLLIVLTVGLLGYVSIPAAQTTAGGEGAYPSRPIRVIVAFPPGGGADFTARAIGQRLSQALGQPVVVDNRPGANGVVGASAVAKSAADGYTLLLIDRGALGINPSLYKSLSYDPVRDFSHVGIAVFGPYVLTVSPKLGAKDLNGLLELAKSNPGAINYATFGVGSMAQLNIEALAARHGIRLTHVPYKGGGPAAMAVVTGEVGLTVLAVPAVLGFIRDGRMRALAIGSTARSPLLPEVPTLEQAGCHNDMLVPTYFGFSAPAGTPRPIVAKLSAEIRRVLGEPELAERFVKAGLEPYGSSPDEMLELVKRDIVQFAGLVKSIGIQPE